MNRIQLRRTKGWRKPEGAIVVSRPSRWGNPFAVGEGIVSWEGETDGDPGEYGQRVCHGALNLGRGLTAAEAVKLFRDGLVGSLNDSDPYYDDMRAALAELAGHDLACWCPLDQPCHADVLLELANSQVPVVPTAVERHPTS